MECIKYINDLEIEVNILENLKADAKDDCSEIEEKIRRKKLLIEKCKDNLNKLSENQVCYRLYIYLLNGLSITKAVEKVAEENYLNDVKPSSTDTIWKYYYPKLKKIINV